MFVLMNADAGVVLVNWREIEARRDEIAREGGHRSRAAARWQRERERRAQVEADLLALMTLRQDMAGIVAAWETNPVGLSGSVVVAMIKVALGKVDGDN
jgi:hypothetical protein